MKGKKSQYTLGSALLGGCNGCPMCGGALKLKQLKDAGVDVEPMKDRILTSSEAKELYKALIEAWKGYDSNDPRLKAVKTPLYNMQRSGRDYRIGKTVADPSQHFIAVRPGKKENIGKKQKIGKMPETGCYKTKYNNKKDPKKSYPIYYYDRKRINAEMAKEKGCVKKNAWIEFKKANAGLGKTMEQLSAEYEALKKKT